MPTMLKRPVLPNLLRTYKLYWQGVAVPISEEMFDAFQDAMLYELTLSFQRRSGGLSGCRLIRLNYRGGSVVSGVGR